MGGYFVVEIRGPERRDDHFDSGGFEKMSDCFEIVGLGKMIDYFEIVGPERIAVEDYFGRMGHCLDRMVHCLDRLGHCLDRIDYHEGRDRNFEDKTYPGFDSEVESSAEGNLHFGADSRTADVPLRAADCSLDQNRDLVSEREN